MNKISSDLRKIATEILAVDSTLTQIADAVKGVSFFSMKAKLEKMSFIKKAEHNNISYLMLTLKNGKKVCITSTKNADAGSTDIVQEGFVIGYI